ncbi:MAG TPA: hypothetical protein VK961_17770 [Chthoniobacter sp.]|nr:hypothetical protein [Chthoniobacter sp.]
MKHTCPVCGWPELHEPPRSASGAASFELCPCCGFEFGFDDDDQGLTYEQARTRWIAGGMKWWSSSRPAPAEWNASRQLARVEPR